MIAASILCAALAMQAASPQSAGDTAGPPSGDGISRKCAIPGPSTPTGTPALLFSSGFEAGTRVLPVQADQCWDRGCWQSIEGTDVVAAKYTSRATWPPDIWQGIAKFQLLADMPVTADSIGKSMTNAIRITTGPRGRRTRALHSVIVRGPNGRDSIGRAATQNSLQLLPTAETGDLYISFWMRFQPDLLRLMRNLPPGPGVDGGGTWRAFFEWKTGSPGKDDGDYRVAAHVLTYGTETAYWSVSGDNVAGGGYLPVNAWRVEAREGPAVPAGRWFKFETFWHRSSGDDGRVWMAVDGRVIADHRGPNTGAACLGINRILWNLYSGSRLPISQWLDDLQIWDGFPAAETDDPWYDPPYAPH